MAPTSPFRIALLAAVLLAISASSIHAHCVQSYAWMISQTVCVYCDRAREFFARNGVPFIEYNLDNRNMWRWDVGDMPVGTIRQFAQNRYGLVGTPIIEIDGVVIRGFLLEALQKETCARD